MQCYQIPLWPNKIYDWGLWYPTRLTQG